MQKNEITENRTKATPPNVQEDINLAAPGRLRVIKRNGKVVAFENEKTYIIRNAYPVDFSDKIKIVSPKGGETEKENTQAVVGKVVGKRLVV